MFIHEVRHDRWAKGGRLAVDRRPQWPIVRAARNAASARSRAEELVEVAGDTWGKPTVLHDGMIDLVVRKRTVVWLVEVVANGSRCRGCRRSSPA